MDNKNAHIRFSLQAVLSNFNGGISPQFLFLLMLQTFFLFLSSFWYSLLQYWLPRSECKSNAEKYEKNEAANLWIEFSKDGKFRAKQYDDNVDNNMSCIVENDIIICTSQNGEIISKILFINNTTLVLQDIADEITRFTKVEKTSDASKWFLIELTRIFLEKK